jgi:Skp family chaperone for outer membrane proteins
MKKRCGSGFVFFLLFLLAFFVESFGKKPGQKIAVQKKEITIEEIQRDKIKWKTLPDSQIIRAGKITKSIGQLKQELALAKARSQDAAKNYAQKAQAKLQDYQIKYRNLATANQARFRQMRLELANSLSKPVRGTITSNLPIGSIIGSPGPPIFSSLDKDHIQGGEPFIIEGKNFEIRVQGPMNKVSFPDPMVKVICSQGIQKDATLLNWTDTKIIAYLSDTNGCTSSSGYIYVETKAGRSDTKPFSVSQETEYDLGFLDGRLGLNDRTTCNVFDEGNLSTFNDHIDVSHETFLGVSCTGTDQLWQNLRLFNGWVVESVDVVKVEGQGTASLANLPVNSDRPLLKINYSVDPWGSSLYADYIAYVYIKGPKGTSPTSNPTIMVPKK